MKKVASEKKADKVYILVCNAVKQEYILGPQEIQKKLPSEPYLAKKYSVSRSSVRKALNILVEEGFIYKVKGSGTYVRFRESETIQVDNIAVILQGVDKDSNKHILDGIKKGFYPKKVNLLIFITHNKLSEERKILEKILTLSIKGVIVEGINANLPNTNLNSYYMLESKNIPLIFYNNYYRNTHFPHIIMNDIFAADMLVKRLVQNGHKHIAGIFMYDNYQGVEKYSGFVRALIKHGGVYDDTYVKWYGTEDLGIKDFANSLWTFIKKLKKSTAIVCCNEKMGQKILEILTAHKKKVPEEYSLVVFDCSREVCESMNIYASIHPTYNIGKKLAQRILLMQENIPLYKENNYSLTISPEFFEGNSVKNLLQ